jgi:hypothetical protein
MHFASLVKTSETPTNSDNVFSLAVVHPTFGYIRTAVT